MATALATLMSLPRVPLVADASPVQPLARLRAALGPSCPALLVKRDDLLPFGFGGNKVRKLESVAAEAVAAGADTLITCGGAQSNHARVTAAVGAVLGLRVILVLNGSAPVVPTGNLRLDELFGAGIRYVAGRDERAPMMEAIAAEVRREGGRPFIVPLGASTPTGALGFARGVLELSAARIVPDVIVHATSSGGTQAGLIAGTALMGTKTRVIGISADASAADARTAIADLLGRMAQRLGCSTGSIGLDREIVVDDRFVGEGYGIATAASTRALESVARREGLVLDPVYTAKAMSGLLALIERGVFAKDETILFWHTGGAPALFA
jgi:1-aminocyclopropane-1-carboxylate deaminase/D-cysteine desulfhydrase-like pyridoxal-dependent ACC family enzyme